MTRMDNETMGQMPTTLKVFSMIVWTLVIGMMDYGKKTGGLGPAIWPTGDFRADMAKVVEFYRNTTPRHPGRAITDFETLMGADANG